MTIRTLSRLSFALAAALFALAASLPATAQQGHPSPVIGVLDTDVILRDSLAAKGVRLERDKYLNQYQQQVKNVETELRDEDQRLAQQRNVLAPDVFQQQAEAFQEKMAVAQQDIRNKQQNLQAAFQQAMIQINREVLQISGQVAQERGLNMIIAQNQVLLSDPGMDITQTVLERLNERLPSVSFPNPDGAAQTAAEGGGEASQ